MNRADDRRSCRRRAPPWPSRPRPSPAGRRWSWGSGDSRAASRRCGSSPRRARGRRVRPAAPDARGVRRGDRRLGRRALRFGPQTPALLDGLGGTGSSSRAPRSRSTTRCSSRRRAAGSPSRRRSTLFLARVRRARARRHGDEGQVHDVDAARERCSRRRASRTHLGGNVGRSLLERARADRARPTPSCSSCRRSSCDCAARGGLPAARRGRDEPLPRPPRPPRHVRSLRRGEARAPRVPDARTTSPCCPRATRRSRRPGSARPGRARRVRFGDGARSTGEGVCVTDGRRPRGRRGRGAGPTSAGFPPLGAAQPRQRGGGGRRGARCGGDVGGGARRARVATRPLPHRLEPVHEADGDPLRRRQHRDDAAERGRRARGGAAAVRRARRREGRRASDAAPLLVAIAREGPRGRRHRDDGPRARRGGPAARGRPARSTAGRDLDGGGARARCRSRARATRSCSRPGYSSLDQYPSFAVRGDRFARRPRRARPARSPDAASRARATPSAGRSAVRPRCARRGRPESMRRSTPRPRR